MTSSPTLPTGPLEHLAMDYARLREEGVRLLGRLAGAQWTDFNAHDPGITILEQLCYAITDLGYRIAMPIGDLLAGTDAAVATPGPAAILTSDPVTREDLRRLVVDDEGVRSAWVEALDRPEIAVYHLQGSDELHLQPDPSEPGARPILITGLHRVLLQPGEARSAEDTLARVAARLHAHRGLCEDLALDLLAPHEVWIDARIEVGPLEDPVELLADVVEAIDAYLAPSPRFLSLSDALADGRRPEALYEGPALARGFASGEAPPLRRALRVSDLIHAITDVPAVRAVRSLTLATSAAAPRERWLLEIPAGHAPTLAAGSELRLFRAGLPVAADPAAVQARLAARRRAAQARGRAADERSLQPPPGRDRHLAVHRSIQHQLPAAYGVGALGLPAEAPAERRAAALQLEAYLLLFDQLLANAFAQLAHARALLSPEAAPLRTYFAQPIDDPQLRIASLLRRGPAAHRAWLDHAVEAAVDGPDAGERRGRFLSHLLARYAEHLGDHAQIGGDGGGRVDARLIAEREAFLRRYPRLSGARGSGHDLLGALDEPSGLAERLRRKLGLGEGRRFHVVEHVLLRPVPEDILQIGDEADPQAPLLAGVAEADPWSLQVSFVFEARPGADDGAFEELVAQTILAETPAHLRPHLRWFADDEDGADWSDFDGAWAAFRAAQRAYRGARVRGAQVAGPIHRALRDARDRVIDLIGLGQTFPLRDLPVSPRLVVAPGASAVITIEESQRGVIYGLRDRRSGAAITAGGAPIEAVGDGGAIALRTPPVTRDVRYRILATKADARGGGRARREAWLHAIVEVQAGVDPRLVADVRGLPRLDPAIDAPRPTDARLAEHGAEVEVVLPVSQEGVVYRLIDDADRGRILSQGDVVGTSGPIVLRTLPLTDDVDLRVHGAKEVGDPQRPELREALLEGALPLRVRADAAIVGAIAPAAIVDHGAPAALRLATSAAGVEYRVWRRRIRDREIVLEDPPADPVLEVAADGARVRVRHPGPARWDGLEPVGEARAGTGAALELPLPGVVEDAILVVTATRRHRATPGGEATVPSTIALAQVHALLVRPDPAPPLRLRIELDGDATTGPIELLGGQPGVLYAVRLGEHGPPLGLPAYVHRRDEGDPQENRGINQLHVEVDLAVARDGDDGASAADPARRAPPPPRIDGPPVPVGARLWLRARRAITGLEVDLAAPVEVAPAPAITLEPARAAAGGAVRVVIAGAAPGERYQLLRGDVVLAEAVADAAAGGRIELDTGPLRAPTRLHVAALGGRDGAVIVERRAAIAVDVAPE